MHSSLLNLIEENAQLLKLLTSWYFEIITCYFHFSDRSSILNTLEVESLVGNCNDIVCTLKFSKPYNMHNILKTLSLFLKIWNTNSNSNEIQNVYLKTLVKLKILKINLVRTLEYFN